MCLLMGDSVSSCDFNFICHCCSSTYLFCAVFCLRLLYLYWMGFWFGLSLVLCCLICRHPWILETISPVLVLVTLLTKLFSRVCSRAMSVWGRVGTVKPPHLVLPLTVEPTKPRLCHDNRFLNLWMKDRPFKLDNFSHLPRYLE